MRGADRSKLRTELVALLDAEFTIGTVKSGRYYDARDGEPYVLVYLAEGQVESESLAGLSASELVIEIGLPVPDNSDDDLDTWGDVLKAVIDNGPDINMGDVIAGFAYEGFEYTPPGESPFLSLNLLFTVYSSRS